MQAVWLHEVWQSHVWRVSKLRFFLDRTWADRWRMFAQALPGHVMEGRLVTHAVWLHRPSGYTGRVVTQAVWLHRPSGYTGRPVTQVVWLHRPSGYTETVWLPLPRLYR